MSTSLSEISLEGGARHNVAVADVTPDLYRELRRIAEKHLGGERRNHTLQPTALVNEAYLKLAKGQARCFDGYLHYVCVASRVMRQVLIDYSRSRATQKRNGMYDNDLWATTVEISGEDRTPLADVIALHDALDALASDDEGLARIVEMHYFGGMTAEETAEALGLSVHIVRHELRLAQAWLRRRFQHNSAA